MPELKRYLDPMSFFQRMLYILVIAFSAGIILLFVGTAIPAGFPLYMLAMPVVLFGGFGALAFFLLRRGLRAYDNWWNSLSDAEREEIGEDFRQGRELSAHLIAGQRFAFLRGTGRPLRYDRIGSIDFTRGRNGRCYVHIEVKGERKMFVDLSSFTAGNRLRDDLLSLAASAAEN